MTECEMTDINVVEADVTRHKVLSMENGEIIRAGGHIVVIDNIGKYMAQRL